MMPPQLGGGGGSSSSSSRAPPAALQQPEQQPPPSTAAGGGGSGALGSEDSCKQKKFPKHLMEMYDVETLLGSGAFSTVWRCRHRRTGEVRAMKKIDTREVSPPAIAREIALMKFLRHKNVVTCYDVSLDAHFVNIVIDIFTGGDLVDGLNTHRRVRGRIPDAQLAHIVRQMVAAVAHVHSLRIVHRDVKGENFLSDRPDIGDPNCTVALADFGTAIRSEPGRKLTERVGTPAFWSPEVWSGSYDFLVDIWAIGITTFILLCGALPFDGETEICKAVPPGKPSVQLPHYSSPACADFITACLNKDPELRPPATEVSFHPWMATPAPTSIPTDKEDVVSHAVGMMVDVVGAIVVGVCSGLGLCFDIILGGAEGAGGRPRNLSAPKSTGSPGSKRAAAAAAPAVSEAEDPATAVAAVQDLEKEATDLERRISQGREPSLPKLKEPKLPDQVPPRNIGPRPPRIIQDI